MMAWSLQEKNTALKLIKENFLKQFIQSTLKLIGSFEIDAIICLSVGNSSNEEQLVIKVHERLKHNHFDQTESRNNGEPSLLREYLAGNASVPKPKPHQPHVAIGHKRKAWDENDNAIYSPDKRTQPANRVILPTLKSEPPDDMECDENPLNLSERSSDPCRARGDKELRSGKIENTVGRELIKQCSCGLCLLRCNTYTALQDHFVDIHNSNLRFYCSECNMGFAESEAYLKHCAQHSGQNQSMPNRRKQMKPRKGVAANDLSDEDIPQNSFRNKNELPLATDCHLPRATSGANTPIDRGEGIVRSLLQKQTLRGGSFLERLNTTKHSTPCPSPLDLVTRDAADSAISEFRCPHCNLLLDSWNLYNEHCKQLHKRFACNVCLQTFTQRVNRDRHHYNHTGEKPYECEQCGLGFTRRDALKKHQGRANHTATPNRSTPQQVLSSSVNFQHEQDLSEDSANDEGVLDASLSIETLDKSEAPDYLGPSSEEVQSKHLSSGQALSRSSGSKAKKHASVFESGSQAEDGDFSDEMSVHSFHSGDNGNQAPDSINTQSTDGGTQPDMAESLKDDPLKLFKCDSCQESVVGMAAFREHCKGMHRRTPCTYCGKTFSQKGNMERHMRQHTGERPFQCQFCNSSYTRKETLKTHVNQTHFYQLNQEFDNL